MLWKALVNRGMTVGPIGTQARDISASFRVEKKAQPKVLGERCNFLLYLFSRQMNLPALT